MLDDDTVATIVHALVTSHLDSGNGQLYGITKRQVNKLQLAQDSAARMLVRTRKFDHISPVLWYLHWLPVRYRIKLNSSFHMESPTWHGTFVYQWTYRYSCSVSSAQISLNKRLLNVPRTYLDMVTGFVVLLHPEFGSNTLQICDFVIHWISSKRL